MNPTTLRAQAAELLSAQKGSRELDADCAIELGWKYVICRNFVTEGFPPDGDCVIDIPIWTLSIDASNDLKEELLPGYRQNSAEIFYPKHRRFISGICPRDPESLDGWFSRGRTEPLARTAAILLALAAKIEGEAK